MVHILRDRKGRDRQQQRDQAEGDPGSKIGRESTPSLHIGFTYHSKEKLVKRTILSTGSVHTDVVAEMLPHAIEVFPSPRFPADHS